jgi:ribonuclease P protein component
MASAICLGGDLKRRYRLAEGERFRQVRQTGTSYSHPLMVLCLLPNELEISRSGFVASRRIGNAVVRNRVRRRLREAVRLLWDVIEPGWDMVWIARPGVDEAEFSELQDACARLLRRARLLKTTSAMPAGLGAVP